MTDLTAYEPMFSALCTELGYCLHEKGQVKVVEALPKGLDAAVRAVLQAEGHYEPAASGDLKRGIRECIKQHLPA